MDKNSFIFSSNNWPLAFLIFCLSFISIEGLFIKYDDFLVDASMSDAFKSQRIKWKYDLIESGGQNFDILIFGDSFNQTGIMPDLLYKETGLQAYNFASFADWTTFGELCALKRYLKKNNPPQYIIVGYSSETFKKFDQNFPEKDLTMLQNLPKKTFFLITREFGLATGIKYLIPSLKHQGFIRKVLRHSFKISLPNNERILHEKSLLRKSKGYYEHLSKKEYVFSDFEKAWIASKGKNIEHMLHNMLESTKYWVEPNMTSQSKKYFLEFCKLAEKYNVKIIYTIPTLSPIYREIQEKIDNEIGKEKLIAELKNSFPHLIMIDAKEGIDDFTFYADPRHLNEKGALIYTRQIVQYINGDNSFNSAQTVLILHQTSGKERQQTAANRTT